MPDNQKRVAALNVKRKDLRNLKPHERNSEIRTHPEEGSSAWETLRKSLEHDYFDPIVWNRRNKKLVSGHLRRKVLLADGVTHADVVVVDYDEATHMARMLAANKAVGEDNFDGLKEFFNELNEVSKEEDGFDFLSLAGYSSNEVEGMIDDMDFSFPSEQSSSTTAPTSNDEESSNEDREVHYSQLAYDKERHELFLSLIAKVKEAHGEEIVSTYGEDSYSCCVLYALSNVLPS